MTRMRGVRNVKIRYHCKELSGSCYMAADICAPLPKLKSNFPEYTQLKSTSTSTSFQQKHSNVQFKKPFLAILRFSSVYAW
jgi:hypothetical protein